MTNLHLIAGSENRDWSPGMEHRPLLISEGRSRLPGRGNRLSYLVYAFLLLALCLMLTDLFHLTAESATAQPQSGMALRASNSQHHTTRAR